MTDAQGRDHATTGELALDSTGKFLALRVRTDANMGAYLSTFAPAIPTYLYATLLAGLYKTPLIHCEVRAIFTNTVPVDAYRGAGRPEACYLLERLVERAARETGIDKTEIRRRNFIAASEMPYQTPVALQYDSGDFVRNMEDALKANRLRRVRRSQGRFASIRQAARHRPRHLHRGLRDSSFRRRRRARRPRRPLRSRRDPSSPDGLRFGVHWLAPARPGPRNDLRAACRRPPRRPDGECRDRSRRH